MQEITVTELYERLKKGEPESLLIDVRTRSEYKALNISFAKNYPLDEIERHTKEFQKYKRVYLHCASGDRSGRACQKLRELGFSDVVNVIGGIGEWQRANLPCEKDKGGCSISLMRQVQITAGLLILLGVGLAHYDFRFLYLSGFVGLGLTFAGLSGSCMMANILAKMWWNR